MDNLFVLYCYLSKAHASNMMQKQEDNPYSQAYRAIDSYLDILHEIEGYGLRVRAAGGFEWADAEKLSERIIAGFATGLIAHHGSPHAAAIAFMQGFVGLEEIDMLIACLAEKQRMEHEEDAASSAREEDEYLAFLESGEAAEDQ